MKKIRVSICILFLLMLPLALLTLSGCAEQNQPEPSTPSTDSPPIASVPTKPSLVVSSTENMRVEKRVLIWESVEHAVKYVVNIDGVEYETTECQFDLHKLTVGGGMFDIDVVAFDDQNTRLDSPGMHITVPFDAPLPSGTDHLGFAYTFCADVVGYEVSAGTADLTGTVVIPEYFCDYPVKKLASKALNPYYLPYIMSSKGDLSYNYINNNKAANTETTAVVLPPSWNKSDIQLLLSCSI